jgi:hypothetical protein
MSRKRADTKRAAIDERDGKASGNRGDVDERRGWKIR